MKYANIHIYELIHWHSSGILAISGLILQLYLLGLPNKLGPLGFLALHHVLTTEEVDAAAAAPSKVGEM